MKKLLLILLLIPSVLFSAQLNAPSTGMGDVSNGVMSTSNFMLEVAKGNVPGHSAVNKFGHNPDAEAGQDVWGGGSEYGFYPTEAEGAQFIDVESTDNTDDIAGGDGALTVTIQGLGENWELVEETVTMTGTTPVEMTQKFFRLFRAFVRTSGADETNAGIITAYIRDAETLANTGIYITAGRGQTQQAIYTIPAGKTGYFIKGYVGMSSPTFQGVEAEFNWLLRVNAFGPGGAWLIQGEIGVVNIGSSFWIYEYGVPAGPMPEKTDIRIELVEETETTGGVDVVAGYDLILVDDGY
jgi:hypothetical protein